VQLQTTEALCKKQTRTACSENCEWNDGKKECEISAAFAVAMLSSDISHSSAPKAELSALSSSLAVLLKENVTRQQLSRITEACHTLEESKCEDECEWDQEARACDINSLVALRAVADGGSYDPGTAAVRRLLDSPTTNVVAALTFSAPEQECQSYSEWTEDSIPEPCLSKDGGTVFWFDAVRFKANTSYKAACMTKDKDDKEIGAVAGPFSVHSLYLSFSDPQRPATLPPSLSPVPVPAPTPFPLPITTVLESSETSALTTARTATTGDARLSSAISTTKAVKKGLLAVTTSAESQSTPEDDTGSSNFGIVALLGLAAVVLCAILFRQKLFGSSAGLEVGRGLDREFAALHSGPE
jgi:hypothetical protein